MPAAGAQQALAERRRTLFELRLQKERGEVKNNRQFPQLKKEIARLLEHIGELNNVRLMEAEGALDAATAKADDEEAVFTPPSTSKSATAAPKPAATAVDAAGSRR